MMKMQMRQTMAMECSVCKQLMFDELVEDGITLAALFGALRYAVCPCCRMEKGKPWTKAYKNRCDKFIAENRKRLEEKEAQTAKDKEKE